MPLHVQREVVGPREGPRALVALEGLQPGVFPVVPGQLVGPVVGGKKIILFSPALIAAAAK